jgi:hypothetical protein
VRADIFFPFFLKFFRRPETVAMQPLAAQVFLGVTELYGVGTLEVTWPGWRNSPPRWEGGGEYADPGGTVGISSPAGLTG